MLQWTKLYMYIFELVVLFSLDKVPEVEMLDCMLIQFLIFWEISILFSMVVPSMYGLINSAWRFPFLHILANICYFLSFL